MGYAYLFALIVALGILLVQVVMGQRGDHLGVTHAGMGPGAHAHHDHATDGEAGFWTLFLSFRFWTFAALGFGFSGSLIHAFALASPLATALIASGAGVASGLFAAMAFRVLSRASTSTEARATSAIGKVGRVMVSCGRGTTGQVRVQIGGADVDFLASTDEEELSRGEAVLIADMRDGMAVVTRPPREVQ